MSDFIEDYYQKVKSRLSEVMWPGYVKPSFDDSTSEVLFFPSFHPETIIQVAKTSFNTTLRVATSTEQIWHYVLGSIGCPKPKLADKELRQALPLAIEEVTHIPEESAERFWSVLTDIQRSQLDIDSEHGLDGITVHASCRHNDKDLSFKSWSPTPDSPQGKYIRLHYDLAWNHLDGTVFLERLEQLHGYLGYGLPVRLIEDDILRVRFFNSLYEQQINELRGFFNTLPKNVPLIIDMSNFEGMGTLLYRELVKFARNYPQIAWVASDHIRKEIEEIPLPKTPDIFNAVISAKRWLTRNE